MLENPIFQCLIGVVIGMAIGLIILLAALAVQRTARAIRARKAGRRYSYNNAGFISHSTMLLPLLLLIAGLAGCQTSGTIRAAAVDSTFRRIAARHDAYVNADPALTPLAKSVAMQDTAVLRGVLDEANKTVTPAPVTPPPATQPSK